MNVNVKEVVVVCLADIKLSDVVILIVSQPNPYHADRARSLQVDLIEQMKEFSDDDKPAVYLTHKTWPDMIGAWTIFPLLTK